MLSTALSQLFPVYTLKICVVIIVVPWSCPLGDTQTFLWMRSDPKAMASTHAYWTIKKMPVIPAGGFLVVSFPGSSRPRCSLTSFDARYRRKAAVLGRSNCLKIAMLWHITSQPAYLRTYVPTSRPYQPTYLPTFPMSSVQKTLISTAGQY